VPVKAKLKVAPSQPSWFPLSSHLIGTDVAEVPLAGTDSDPEYVPPLNATGETLHVLGADEVTPEIPSEVTSMGTVLGLLTV
jgi:hypothetical protein